MIVDQLTRGTNVTREIRKSIDYWQIAEKERVLKAEVGGVEILFQDQIRIGMTEKEQLKKLKNREKK